MEKMEMKPTKVRYCDFCGAPAKQGEYSNCDTCHRDLCDKHAVFGFSEEECICRECYAKRFPACPTCGRGA